MGMLDERCGDEKDFKLSLSPDDLKHFLGTGCNRQLEQFFSGGFNEVKLRRCCEHGKCINFHTDVALCTLQIPLNGDADYSGGRLIYLNGDGLHIPSRPSG